jgi:uncharacterized protein YutE (UPF0331/DUF86 family)
VTPGRVNAATAMQKAAQVKAMLAGIHALPLDSLERFSADPRNAAAAESYLRRALEALLDLGRHVLAKVFGKGPAEYKEISVALVTAGVLTAEQGRLMTELAGYRNRMVHFYDEVSTGELYEICRDQVSDVQALLDAHLDWLRRHPDKVDGRL